MKRFIERIFRNLSFFQRKIPSFPTLGTGAIMTARYPKVKTPNKDILSLRKYLWIYFRKDQKIHKLPQACDREVYPAMWVGRGVKPLVSCRKKDDVEFKDYTHLQTGTYPIHLWPSYRRKHTFAIVWVCWEYKETISYSNNPWPTVPWDL